MSQPRVGSWTPGPPFALPLLCPPPMSADVHSFLKCAQRWHPHRFIDESFPQKTLPPVGHDVEQRNATLPRLKWGASPLVPLGYPTRAY